jgi:hypothetical protein
VYKIFKFPKVVLREERRKGDYRFLSAEIKANGDLVFEGQDLGAGVEGAYGASEYEWYWTVKSEDIPLFERAIGGKGNILNRLLDRFSKDKAAELFQYMQDNEIPFESWSRIGD